MSTQTTKAESHDLVPGIAQALMFIIGAVVFGILAITAAKPVLWILSRHRPLRPPLAHGVLDYRAKGIPKTRWITPPGYFAMIAIVFGSLHSTPIR